ncbi:hypothetical protein G9A89_008977 [Geosiphon pyriformis]|nr:hypothetical protein G9A89_008977 [Geosiphon pyriformis]
MTQRGPITCHILDSSRGQPASNVLVKLEVKSQELNEWTAVAERRTDHDGRCSHLLSPDYQINLVQHGDDPPRKAIYRITFFTKAYFDHLELETFFPYVQVVFEITDLQQHYHIPLLLSPFSYTTYRGS